MARTRVKLSAMTAAGAIALAWGAWYFGKEPQFRRDPLTETLGLARIAATYEARYENCADERIERRSGLRGLAWGVVGRSAHDFPAMSDAAAVAYARAALPDCTLASLMRKRRFALRRIDRHDRFPVDIGG